MSENELVTINKIENKWIVREGAKTYHFMIEEEAREVYEAKLRVQEKHRRKVRRNELLF